MIKTHSKPLNVFVALVLSFSVFGCGSDSTPSGPELSGTVASGAPVAQGTAVTIKDANGVTRTTKTLDSNGLYKVSVGDLTPPFVICVDGNIPPPATPCAAGTGTDDKVLMTVVPDNKGGTANVTPLTKLAAANAAGVTDPTSIFNTVATLKTLTADKITQGMTAITTLVGDYLKAAGIDPSQFSPLTTKFTANGTGVDSVMDVVKPKLDANGKVNISFKGYTSNKPSFDISKPFAQYTSSIRTNIKTAWSNVAAQITPATGSTPIIPSNVTLPPGFQIPANATIPAGVQIPPGVTIPAGVKFDPSVKIDPLVSLPSGVTAPTGGQVAVAIPPNAIIPSGVTLPANVTIPAGVTLPAGFVVPTGATLPSNIKLPTGVVIPAGVTLPTGIKLPDNVDLSAMNTTMPAGITIPTTAAVPTSWQNPATAPTGVIIPTGVTYGAPPTTPTTPTIPNTGSVTCDAGYTLASSTANVLPNMNVTTVCSSAAFCSNGQNGGYFLIKGTKITFDVTKINPLDSTYLNSIVTSLTNACQ